MTDDQQGTIAFLSRPSAFGLPEQERVERIDTHISIVWLVGARAYKLKRAVLLDYVDFSTSELRRLACEAEVRLNRRTAPSLYLGVCAIRRSRDGELSLDGEGEAIDWLIEMARFSQDALFDRLAERRALSITLMDGLAEAIAQLHARAERRPDHGGREEMTWVVKGNAEAFAAELPGGTDRDRADRATRMAEEALQQHGALLDARRQRGSVRVCHGDLHLRNICLLNGVPTLFDAVEFNEKISCIDVLYDLAFLLMDLWHRDLRGHANAAFNGYLDRTVDLDGLPLLPLFLSCRAAVRAKISVTAAGVQVREDRRRDLQREVRAYLALAESLLQPSPPRLIAIGGFSGSGKSTLARQLAPSIGAVPGALTLRSDVIRKRQHAVSPLTRLGPEAYSVETSRHIYQSIADRALVALRAGQAVIADAVYASPDERWVIERVAQAAGAPFLGLWLEAEPTLLAGRIRQRSGDASDATPGVLERQVRAGVGSMGWRRVDASVEAALVCQRVQAMVSEG